MSFRHVHITEFLYLDNESQTDINEFIRSLDSEFTDVQPNWGQYGRISWIVMYGRDSNGRDEELAMPSRMKNLEGILKSDVKIVSAWEGHEEGHQTIWYARGRGDITVEEYLEKRLQ